MAEERKFLYNQSGDRPIYRSRKLNKNNPNVITNEGSMGLEFNSTVNKALGREGVDKVNEDLGIKGTLVSTGGGDVMKKNEEFTVAYSDEEAEDIRESTNGEVKVRRPQKRKKNGQFGGSIKEDEAELMKKMSDDEDYLKKMSGKSDEEWESIINSIEMTKEEFIKYAKKNIFLVSNDYVNKQKLLSHLNVSKRKRKYKGLDRTSNLTDRQKRDFVREYDDKVQEKKGDIAGKIVMQEIFNENIQKAKNKSKKMKKHWNSKRASNRMKQMHENSKQNQNTSDNNFDKVRNEATSAKNVNLSQYSQDEINLAKEEAKKYGGNPNDQMELEYRIKQNRKERGQ